MLRQANIKGEDADSRKTSPTPKTFTTIFGIIIVVILQLFQQLPSIQAAGRGLQENSPCETNGEQGICKTWAKCAIHKTRIEGHEYSNKIVENCGFTVTEELICCPIVSSQTNDDKFPQPRTVSISEQGPSPRNDRPAVKACDSFRSKKKPSLSQHILAGTVAKLGEFPHMVAILYSLLANNGDGPYECFCGGTLIDERFVLTAAHCLDANKYGIPSFVRMGVVNFTDPEEMSVAVEIRIKQHYIHDGYLAPYTYNDIAILELEHPVGPSEYIYPACLHTDEADPGPDVKLSVTGWGVINDLTHARSNVLMKASLNVTPLHECNDRFEKYGLTRHLRNGIVRTQLCAEDANNIKDTCQGDSGGPLHMSLNEKLSLYSVVGVVASGIGCAAMPGLYTRVASYLDFIEHIVWPNGVH